MIRTIGARTISKLSNFAKSGTWCTSFNKNSIKMDVKSHSHRCLCTDIASFLNRFLNASSFYNIFTSIIINIIIAIYLIVLAIPRYSIFLHFFIGGVIRDSSIRRTLFLGLPGYTFFAILVIPIADSGRTLVLLFRILDAIAIIFRFLARMHLLILSYRASIAIRRNLARFLSSIR